MASLLLGGAHQRTPLDVVQWFGAMQAQDVASGHWSIGVRCADSTEAAVLDTFENREIVRTWPMRGTIHIVPACDVAWMLELTGSRALAGSVRRREQLGITDRDAETATQALVDALRVSPVLTRAQAVDAMVAAGVDVSGQRAYHLLSFAAHVGVVCIGPQRGSDQTFVLLEQWAPSQVRLARDDALIELLFRFVRSHGPVGLRDFAGWSGLTLGHARQAAAGNAGRLAPLASDVGELWATTQAAERIDSDEIPAHPVVALPGFDEFMLGYKDRSLHAPAGVMDRIVPGGNGVFRGTVVADGVVVATWKRLVTPDRVIVDLEPLDAITVTRYREVTTAFVAYAHFLDRRLELRGVT